MKTMIAAIALGLFSITAFASTVSIGVNVLGTFMQYDKWIDAEIRNEK